MATFTAQVGLGTDDARNISGNGTFNATVVTQHLGNNAGVDYWNGWRWTGVTIPQGARINSATLDLFSAGVGTGTSASCIFYGELTASPVTFANTTTDKPEGRTRTTASVVKTFTPSQWTTTGFGKDLIDVTTLVQEIVNQATYASGNALAIVGHNNGSASNNFIGHSTFDSSAVRGATLTVTYTTGAGTTGQVKVYNGSAFVAKPVKVWNGSAWVIKPLKRWNGSAWVITQY